MLGVTRESPRAEISKSYRKLAGRWHPDRFQKKEEKEEAEKTFLKIAAAYDVLKDEESREEYNYMLDHPEEMWQNYYRYYRRRMAPKVRMIQERKLRGRLQSCYYQFLQLYTILTFSIRWTSAS